MKKRLVSVFLFAGSAFASQVPNPLLTLQTTPGFVRPEFAKSVSCKIYSDRVQLVTHRATEAQPEVKTHDVEFSDEVASLEQLAALVDEAEQGQVVKGIAPADIPGYTYLAIKTIGAGAPKPITLKRRYDGGREDNQSEAAKVLERFIDLNCQ